MLIMITNKCNEGCPHCMECSNPNGGMMDAKTFDRAIRFSDFIGCTTVTVSGGEPTLHPQFYDFCKQLNFKYKKNFSICTNGTWYNDQKIAESFKTMREKFEHCIGIQVYSNKNFYKSYEEVSKRAGFFKSLGCVFEEIQIRAMKDLGRAKDCEEAQKMIAVSPYFQSCLNACLAARQVRHPKQYGFMLEYTAHQFCHPMVDFNGNVHLSESWLCPSAGNVGETHFANIWNNITTFKPCGGCKNFKHFLESQRLDIITARKILEL